MNKYILYSITLATSLLITKPSQAAILNGGFETGDFSNWNTGGDVAVARTVFDDSSALAPEGTYLALLSNSAVVGGGALDINTLESSTGLPSGSLTSRGALSGSFIAQTFSANAGDNLSFNWNFFTNEFTNFGATTNDFAFFSIIPNVESLADVNTGTFTTAANTSFFSATTGLQSLTRVLPSTGDYRLVFGVANVGDNQAESGLAIDSVVVNQAQTNEPEPVPEPLTILGSGMALGFGSLMKRQHSKKLKKTGAAQ